MNRFLCPHYPTTSPVLSSPLQEGKEGRAIAEVLFNDPDDGEGNKRRKELVEAWKIHHECILRDLYEAAMFVGHDGRPILDFHWLQSIRRDGPPAPRPVSSPTQDPQPSSRPLGPTLRSSASATPKGADDLPSIAGSSTSTAEPFVLLSAVRVKKDSEAGDEVSSVVESICQEADAKAWTVHMTWCNKQVKKEIAAFKEIIDLADAGAHRTCTVVRL